MLGDTLVRQLTAIVGIAALTFLGWSSMAYGQDGTVLTACVAGIAGLAGFAGSAAASARAAQRSTDAPRNGGTPDA